VNNIFNYEGEEGLFELESEEIQKAQVEAKKEWPFGKEQKIENI
jgi:hypothetical protein